MVVKNLRASREDMDLKQKDIAEMFNVNFSTVSGRETGKDTIPLERLVEYANRFNFSLDYLFGIRKINDTSYLPLTLNLDVIAKNLKRIRKEYNLTQEDVSKIINTSQASYAHYENSIYLIPTNFLYNLTKIYKNISIDSLLGRKKQ